MPDFKFLAFIVLSSFETRRMESITLDRWEDICQPAVFQQLESNILPGFLMERRWFGGKGREINVVRIIGTTTIPADPLPSFLWLLLVEYKDGASEKYLLPVCFLHNKSITEDQMRPPLLCDLKVDLEQGWLSDATWCEDFRMALFRLFARQARLNVEGRQMIFNTSDSFGQLAKNIQASRVLNAEQSNSSIIFGNTLFLKLYRKVETGTNPDIELSRFLSQDANFKNVPGWMGDIEWQSPAGKIGVGILQQLLPDIKVAWEYFQPVIKEAIKTSSIDVFRENLEQLASLTAEMHRALSSRQDSDEFQPEPFGHNEIHEMINDLSKEVDETFDLLANSIDQLSPEARSSADRLLDLRPELEHMLADLDHADINMKSVRVHGDYHLGQVLVSGDDLKVTDFEGEPGRSYTERRAKQPLMKDVAGMMRSLQYATYNVLMDDKGNNHDIQQLAEVYNKMSDVYVETYLSAMIDTGLVPVTSQEAHTVLRLFLLEKALYELRYELNNRPNWTIIPLAGLVSIITEWMESGVQHA